MSNVVLHTSWGDVALTMQGQRIAAIQLPFLVTTPAVTFRPQDCRIAESSCLNDPLRCHLQDYFRTVFAGKSAVAPEFMFPEGGAFRVRVWMELLRILPGEVVSYGVLAKRLGQPRAARAVGSACGANPLPILIPCHRVVTSQGALGGFSCGLPWKCLLLSAESHWCRQTGLNTSSPASPQAAGIIL